MAENFFGIEDAFTETEKVNDILFTDTLPDDLENIKKKKEEEEAAKLEADKAKAEAERKRIEEAKKAPAVKKTKEELEAEKVVPIDDPTSALFGKVPEKEDVEIEKTDKIEDEDEDDAGAGDDANLSQFEILSKELYNIGVFVPDIDEDSNEEVKHLAKTPEEFKKLFDYQKQNGMYAMLDNHLSKFGQDRLELFDAIFNKGVEPKEYLPVYNALQNLEDLSLDEETNQEKVVREAYKRNGLSDDKIDNKIKRLKDISELQAEAEDLKTMLIEQDKKALKQQEDDKLTAQKNQEIADNHYKASLVKILNEKIAAKEFDGIPVTQQTAQKAYDYLYNKKWQDASGKKFTDFDKFYLELSKPENYSQKIKTALLWQNNLDLSKVQQKAVSKESSELFKEFAEKKTKQAKKTVAAPWNL